MSFSHPVCHVVARFRLGAVNSYPSALRTISRKLTIGQPVTLATQTLLSPPRGLRFAPASKEFKPSENPVVYLSHLTASGTLLP